MVMSTKSFSDTRVGGLTPRSGNHEELQPVSAGPAFGRWARLCCVIIFATLVLACRPEVEPPAERIRPVKVLEVGEGSSTFRVEYPGIIEAAREAPMAFEVAGRIIEFPVVEGDRLQKGELIARLDPRDFEESLAKRQANSDFLKVEYGRHKSLYEQGVDSKQVVDKALKNYQISVSSVAQATKALEDSELRAPFDGLVAVKLVKDFRNVQAKEQVVLFEDDSHFKIVVQLPEADYARITPGLTLAQRNANADIDVAVTSLPGHLFSAQLTEAAGAADPVTRTFRVTLTFEPSGGLNVSSGMTAKVIASSDILPDAEGDFYLIPVQAALGNEAGKAFVWMLDPSTMEVHQTSVELGSVSGSMVRVVGGLEDGDQVAVSGVGQLREGMRVRRFGN